MIVSTDLLKIRRMIITSLAFAYNTQSFSKGLCPDENDIRFHITSSKTTTGVRWSNLNVHTASNIVSHGVAHAAAAFAPCSNIAYYRTFGVDLAMPWIHNHIQFQIRKWFPSLLATLWRMYAILAIFSNVLLSFSDLGVSRIWQTHIEHIVLHAERCGTWFGQKIYILIKCCTMCLLIFQTIIVYSCKQYVTFWFTSNPESRLGTFCCLHICQLRCVGRTRNF